ncbi:hypothetical protein TI39_contig4149g00015 [Zymoseptoria brevis]|uniref:Uncharacterized protein n=1 Tax=Zymoseptoria brevis TaxID=1047168 RepID=A0A0F4GC90_9PEZI|nr:hypothetical protein TI39_contig4149g00015 [Zymoseptoria brevis]
MLLVTVPGVILALLVRRASKTPRDKALAAIDSGSPDHYGYITREVFLPRRIRLLRKVNAPILDGAPELVCRRMRWNNERDITLEAPGWIQMAEALKAFGMTFETRDSLVFDCDNSFGMGHRIGHNDPRLPISPSWIFALGLAGRFGVRPDDGKWPKQLLADHHTPFGSDDTVPGRLPAYQWDDFEEPFPDWARNDATNPPAMPDFDMMTRARLAGLVGSVRFGDWPDSHISFTGHGPDEIGANLIDTLDVAILFWLAVGCLPMQYGRVIGLDNIVQEVTTEPVHLPVDLGSVPGGPFASSKGRRKKNPGKRHRNGTENIKASYLGALVTFTNDNIASKVAHAEVPHLYRLSATNNRVDALSNLAALVGAETAATHALSLEELQTSPEEMSELIADSGETLEAAMLELLVCITPFKYTRAFGAALSSLDDLIGSVRNMPSRILQVVVQAVVLTSREFRDLIVQSLRIIEDCMPTSLFIDIMNSPFDMEAILGTMKKFPVDLGILLPELTSEEKLVRWQIPYTYVLLLTLRAALKSAYLRASLDSQPLFNLVPGMDDVGYVQ